jgi:hypothetical protein
MKIKIKKANIIGLLRFSEILRFQKLDTNEFIVNTILPGIYHRYNPKNKPKIYIEAYKIDLLKVFRDDYGN